MADLNGSNVTDEQIRVLFDELYEEMDDHGAYAAARALLPVDHYAYNAKLRDEARERCARTINERNKKAQP